MNTYSEGPEYYIVIPTRTQVETFLAKQPDSYAGIYTVESYVKAIIEGKVFVLGLVDAPTMECLGIVAYSLLEYPSGIRSLKVDFMSCENPYKMKALILYLERIAPELGCSMIEAIAHPALAEYGVNKMGYSAPALYVTKSLTQGRIN